MIYITSAWEARPFRLSKKPVILSIPELQDEIDRLRIWKAESENRIANAGSAAGKADREKLVSYLKKTAEDIETNPTAAVKELVKIYAHVDGTCTVNIGVNTRRCGGRI